jgi:hypothetical protein
MVCLGETMPVLAEISIACERKGHMQPLYLWGAKKEVFNLFETPKVQNWLEFQRLKFGKEVCAFLVFVAFGVWYAHR